MYDKVIGKVVVKCPECAQKLRFPLFQHKTIEISCPKCNKKFDFDCRKYRLKKQAVRWSVIGMAVAIIITDAILPLVLFRKSNAVIAKAKNKAESNYALRVQKIEKDFSKEIEDINEAYAKEVARIDANALRLKASSHYEEIWQARSNFDRRYAMSPREKTQLEMLALANTSTDSIEKTIRGVARRAAPKNSRIRTVRSSAGIALDIDFDMSELTSGEEGTRTKHLTLDSLKKETVRLISRVTNDVYQFCGDLGLRSITIGCRHFVTTESLHGSPHVENIVIYKIEIDKTSIAKLEHNPFLDTYSTTKHFKVIEDKFPILEIKLSAENFYE